MINIQKLKDITANVTYLEKGTLFDRFTSIIKIEKHVFVFIIREGEVQILKYEKMTSKPSVATMYSPIQSLTIVVTTHVFLSVPDHE